MDERSVLRHVDRPTLILWFAAAAFSAAWILPVSVAWSTATDLGHAYAVPLLVAYLWWERWNERPAMVARDRLSSRWWILLLAALSIEFPLRLFLTPYPLWSALLVAYTTWFIGLALTGAWLLGRGPAVRWLAGPLLLTLITLPAPAIVDLHLIHPLRELMASLAGEVSNLFGYPALAKGTSLQLANGWVGIDEACGGIRSLQACAMIGLFFGEWHRFGVVRRIALLAVGVGVALAGNFLRVVFLSLRAGAGTESIESVHDLAGWFAMAASLVITGWIACRWAGYRWPEQRLVSRPPRGRSVVPTWCAVAAIALVAADLATRAWFARGEALWKSSPKWTVAFPQQNSTFRPEPLGHSAREMLRPAVYAAGSWTDPSGGLASAYYIEWHSGQIARFVPFLHNPTVCLPLSGCELMEALPTLNINQRSQTIPFNAYRFRRLGQDFLVAFTIWDPARNQPLEQSKNYDSWLTWLSVQWEEVREGHRDQPAQLFTLMIPWTENARSKAEKLLHSMIVEPK